MRTAKEIKAKIKSVTTEYSKLPHFSFFGDNNWEARDTILEYLNKAINDKFFDVDEELEQALIDRDENPEDGELENKINTLDWLVGHTDEL